MTYAYADNITRLHELMHYASNVTDGVFGLTMLVVVFLVAFIAMRQSMASYEGQNAKIFSASAFITTFFATMFYILGIVNTDALYVCIFVTAISAFANLIAGR